MYACRYLYNCITVLQNSIFKIFKNKKYFTLQESKKLKFTFVTPSLRLLKFFTHHVIPYFQSSACNISFKTMRNKYLISSADNWSILHLSRFHFKNFLILLAPSQILSNNTECSKLTGLKFVCRILEIKNYNVLWTKG